MTTCSVRRSRRTGVGCSSTPVTGVCAAFGSARAAIDAAVAAQQTLRLPVRMGISTGEAERREEDYFGPVLNRTARVMTAGHGGQILMAASTAAVVSGVDLIGRGE